MYFDRIFQMKEGCKVSYVKIWIASKFLGDRYLFEILHTSFAEKTGKNVVDLSENFCDGERKSLVVMKDQCKVSCAKKIKKN